MRWCLALALTANTVVASGQTAISGLAQRSDAIALVEVAFVPYGDLVLVEEVLHGEIVGLTSSNALLGDCLPRRATVKKLAAESATPAQAAVYNGALEMAMYKAVIFLKHAAGSSSVICSDAITSTENWESDPRYPMWRSRLDAYLENADKADEHETKN
jgi:hypothetical protein